MWPTIHPLCTRMQYGDFEPMPDFTSQVNSGRPMEQRKPLSARAHGDHLPTSGRDLVHWERTAAIILATREARYSL